ncbi:MAG: archaeal heat shock protein Hsp20 [Candidatus Hodarchaeota archaeon]
MSDKDERRWWRRKRRWDPFDLFNEDEGIFESIMEQMEDFIRKFTRLPSLFDEESMEKWGKPFVYGFSLDIGPDGKPRFREFGNLKSSGRDVVPSQEREPLVDVFEEAENVRIIAEIPGVVKEAIDLKGSEFSLTIRASDSERSYYKEVSLPVAVDPASAKATYNNGVLEVVLKRKEPKEKEEGHDIKVE